MKLELVVDIDKVAGDAADELGRILRYWAGAMKQFDLSEGLDQAIYDSAYTEVGKIHIG